MQLKNVMRYKTEELLGTYNAMQSAKNALSTGMFYASITILWIIVISYAVGTLYFLILAIWPGWFLHAFNRGYGTVKDILMVLDTEFARRDAPDARIPHG